MKRYSLIKNLRLIMSGFMVIFAVGVSPVGMLWPMAAMAANSHETIGPNGNANPGDNITICHATASVNNPYITESPNANGDVQGHAEHTGDIWTVSNKNGDNWGDIIPPFTYNDKDGHLAGSYAGLNWTTEGQAIWSADCTPTSIEGATTGSLTVTKIVVNPPEGVSSSSFTIHVKRGNGDAAPEDVDGSPQAGSSTGTTYDDLNPGNYFVSEDTGPGTYTLSYSGGCDSDGKVQVSKNGSSDCTLTNTYAGRGGVDTGTLIVKKHVINDDGGTKTAANFTMSVTATTPSQSSFAGSESGTTVTVAPGTYSVDEGSHTGYTESKSADCSGTIAAGDTKTCTITNNDTAGSGSVLGESTGPGQGAVLGASTVLPATGSESDWPVLVSMAGGAAAFYLSRRRQGRPVFEHWEI